MKVGYPICCSIDIHKTFPVATIITSQRILPTTRKRDSKLLTTPFYNSSSEKK